MTLWTRRGPLLLAVLALAVSACGDPISEGRGRLEQSGPDDAETEQPAVDEGEPTAPVEGQTGTTDIGSECAAILGVEEDQPLDAARQDYRELDLVSALEEIDELSHVSSSFQTPDAREDFSELEEITLFAPVSEAFNARALEESGPDSEDESADDNSYTQWPASVVLSAHLIGGESLSIAGLAEQGEVELADGTTIEVTSDEGVATVTRGDLTAEVLCGDIEVDDGFIHVIDTVLFENEETDMEDDELGSNQEVPRRGSDASDATEAPSGR